MTFASYKRFEQTGEIAFRSLCNIAIALGCEQDFDELFAHRQYTSIQEVIDAQREARKRQVPASVDAALKRSVTSAGASRRYRKEILSLQMAWKPRKIGADREIAPSLQYATWENSSNNQRLGPFGLENADVSTFSSHLSSRNAHFPCLFRCFVFSKPDEQRNIARANEEPGCRSCIQALT